MSEMWYHKSSSSRKPSHNKDLYFLAVCMSIGVYSQMPVKLLLVGGKRKEMEHY